MIYGSTSSIATNDYGFMSVCILQNLKNRKIKMQIALNPMLPEVACTKVNTKRQTFFSFLFLKEGKFLKN